MPLQPRKPTAIWAALGGVLLAGEPSPLLSTAVLGPVSSSPGQERDGYTGEGPTKGQQDNEGIGASLLKSRG